MEGYFLPRLRSTADEAAVLALGGAFARERVDAEPRRAADEALRKLEGVLLQTQGGSGASRWWLSRRTKHSAARSTSRTPMAGYCTPTPGRCRDVHRGDCWACTAGGGTWRAVCSLARIAGLGQRVLTELGE